MASATMSCCRIVSPIFMRLRWVDASGLIEAMGRGALVLYLNTPENAEVAGGVGIPFESGDLAEKLGLVIAMPVEEARPAGRSRHGSSGRTLRLGRCHRSVRAIASQPDRN